MLTETGVGLAEPRRDGADAYWLESRPLEAGRTVIVRRRADGTIEDALPQGWNARTLVHEYGGAAYAVHGGTVFFTHFDDQRLYRLDPGGEPAAITLAPPEARAWRYADFDLSSDGSTIYCVRERHDTGGEPANEVVSVPADGSAPPQLLAAGRDFYAAPRVSPDGTRLAWLEWDHPNMPWDGTTLQVARVGAAGPATPERVAGGPGESVFQPAWGPDGVLHFVSDRSGWWNLYRAGADGPAPLAPRQAEFGLPAWVFGMSRYGFLDDGRPVCVFREGGVDHLAVLGDGGLQEVPAPAELSAWLAPGDGEMWAVGGGADLPMSIVRIGIADGETEVVRPGSTLTVPAGYLSVAEPIEFPTAGGLTAHAYFYAPANRDFAGPEDELPPLLVVSHGGPTSATSAELDPGYQYWTSRGFAIVDVDYGGSTGYGRAYRERLAGTWGIVDVEDCINAARHLVAEGKVDGNRLAIRGGSAGGFTTLNALAFHDVFAAGASYFGVADLGGLAEHTHKFESRYLDRLVGPWPDAEDLYRERSAAYHADGISCPVILFQGLEDAVVPPAQAEAMVAALDANRVPHAYVAFAGEQHGFRMAATQIRAREAELWFYGRIFGFTPADDVEPVEMAHL